MFMSVILPAVYIIAIIVLDRITKLWASSYLSNVGTIPIIQDVLHLTYAENTGMAFSLFSGKRFILVVLSILAVIAIIWLLRQDYFDTALGKWAAYTVIGGAIGNLIDRIVYGFVVDMIDVRIINFAIFNVADSFVCIGGGMFILYVILEWRRESKRKHNNDDTEARE
ncbi:MAG: signal peptidase II [Clostridiales bacterium]|nr:signal peptidase II [Clostridiales bacterium]